MELQLEPDLMLVESAVSEVYDAPGSVVYNVLSKLDGQQYVTRAYTAEMGVRPDGFVEFDVVWKRGGKQYVAKPFHWLNDGVLYAFKRNKQRNSDAFALNHELFALEWDACVVLHFIDGEPFVFVASADEWLAASHIGQRNQELQVFLMTPDFRRLPARMMPAEGFSWMKRCLTLGGGGNG